MKWVVGQATNKGGMHRCTKKELMLGAFFLIIKVEIGLLVRRPTKAEFLAPVWVIGGSWSSCLMGVFLQPSTVTKKHAAKASKYFMVIVG